MLSFKFRSIFIAAAAFSTIASATPTAPPTPNILGVPARRFGFGFGTKQPGNASTVGKIGGKIGAGVLGGWSCRPYWAIRGSVPLCPFTDILVILGIQT